MLNPCADSGAKSDSGDSGLGPLSGSPDPSAVCRDFLRHVCKRGRRCKYRHPDADECAQLVRAAEPVFCHDYQNAGCQRPSCKFVHCSREEEAAYRATGTLPVRLQLQLLQAAAAAADKEDDVASQGGGDRDTAAAAPPQPPVCKDFLKGACTRGARCRFRHVGGGGGAGGSCGASAESPPVELHPRAATPPSAQELFELAKRRRLDMPVEIQQQPQQQQQQQLQSQPSTMMPHQALSIQAPIPSALPTAAELPPPAQQMAPANPFSTAAVATFGFLPAAAAAAAAFDWGGRCEARLLAEENASLRRRVEELRKQCVDLLAANELLLDQNARLRGAKLMQLPPQTQQPVVSAAAMTPSTTSLDIMTYAHAAMQAGQAVDFAAAAAAAAAAAVTGNPAGGQHTLLQQLPAGSSAAAAVAAAAAYHMAFHPTAKLAGQLQ